MYYLLVLLLILLGGYVIIHIVGSLIKGCITAGFVVIIVILVGVFIKSARTPVELFGRYIVEDFKVRRVTDK